MGFSAPVTFQVQNIPEDFALRRDKVGGIIRTRVHTMPCDPARERFCPVPCAGSDEGAHGSVVTEKVDKLTVFGGLDSVLKDNVKINV